MERTRIDGIELECELRGSGDAVVFVHHGAGVDWFEPLMREPALATRHRIVHYHREGYAASSPLAAPLTFAREAANFGALMRALGVTRAHVVGHSASGCMALAMALDAPDSVQSLALLEPALMTVASPPQVAKAIELYRAGDTAAALETFLRATCGPQSAAIIDKMVPNATRQAIADAATFFGHELPALRQWTFGRDEARRIRHPVLAVVGERSDARFHERHALLLEWLPNVEPFVLPAAGHLLHLENPRALADALVDFFARHPISAAA
jgi:pimeloyl-ACP methyl ester carboxylesterase